jgi:LacI family transcriptional regulator
VQLSGAIVGPGDHTAAVAARLAVLAVPFVDVSHTPTAAASASVHGDLRAAANLVAEQFVQRGFRHFAFCGRRDDPKRGACRDAFARYLADHGHMLAAADAPGDDANQLLDWLKPLPRPLAVLACDDTAGRQMLEACHLHGIAVPEDVTVIAASCNDESICELTQPPLSSVQTDAQEVGFHAAEALAELMKGGPAASPREPVLVPPIGIVTRVSSELPAIEDRVVAQALHLIRGEAHRGINVDRLLNHLPVSRATLERRFARVLNRSPKEEILRLRLDRARQLLRETDYTLAAIAKLCGFKTAAHLSVSFKAHVGQSPGQYRAGHS